MPSPFPGMNPYLEQPGVWAGFHNRFLTYASEAITAQVRPRYFVKFDETVYIHEPPAADRFPLGRPDIFLAADRRPVGPGGPAVAAPGRVGMPAGVEEEPVGYLEIRDRHTREVVTVVEVLSPVNKEAGPNRSQYLATVRRVLASRANLVEIDLLRGGPRMPWSGPPACDYCVVVSRPADRAADPPWAGLWAGRLRDPLPAVPVPLRADEADASLHLQAILHRVYDGAGYEDYVYQTPPEPRLAPDDAAWAATVVSPPERPPAAPTPDPG